MTQSMGDLLKIVYSYYPRRALPDDPGYKASQEYSQLLAARRKAAAEDDRWHALLQRLERQFPGDSVLNNSLGLSTGGMDAAYCGKVLPAGSVDCLSIGFLVSFLVPYYVVYSSRVVEAPEPNPAPRGRTRVVFKGDTCYILPTWAAKLATLFLGAKESPLTDDAPPRRTSVRFDFSPDEQSYVTCITREIEALWGFQRMPPEVGKAIVPDVSTNLRYFGEATLYDCLFADDWLR